MEHDAKEWLSEKEIDTVTVTVMVSKGACCGGGCGFSEPIIDYGMPKEKQDSYLFFRQDGINIYVAGVLAKKTDSITIKLKKFLFFKRLGLEGCEPHCMWK